jgi:hypothetical protein
VRIFISHSTSNDDADGCKRLDDVEAALAGPENARSGHEVLVDRKRLIAGTPWRPQLHEWMATCHAALVLLTPKALESSWVLTEATVLAHRAALDGKFLLFPALLDGLTRDQVKGSRFSPLYLDAIQRIRATQPTAIADVVLGELARLGNPPATRYDGLVFALAQQLMTVARNNALEGICAKLTGTMIVWDTPDRRALGAARVVAEAIATGVLGEYRSLRDLMHELLLAGLQPVEARSILRLAGPRWVDPEAAAPLAEVAARNAGGQRDEQGRVMSWSTAINGKRLPTFTAEQYLRRAYLPDVPILLVIDGGESDVRQDELISRLRNEVRKEPELVGASDEYVDDFLSNVDSPYFVLLPPPFPDVELLETLQTRYPKLTFIGQDSASRIAERSFAGRVVPLVPPLSDAEEMKALHEFKAASKRIESA